MPNTPEGRERLVAVEVELRGLREQQRQHALDTRDRFQSMDEKIDALLEALNKGKGAFAFAMILSGLIGGVVAKAAAAIWSKVQ